MRGPIALILCAAFCLPAAAAADGRAGGSVAAGTAIAAAAEEYVRARLPWLGDDVEVDVAAVPRDVPVPGGEVSLEVQERGVPKLSGSVSVPVDILVDGKKHTTSYPRLDVRVYRQVAVAARAIPARWTLSAGDVILQRRDVSGLGGRYCLSAGELAGKKTRTRIGVGSVIGSHMVVEPPVVSRGDRVEVSVRSGGCLLTMQGVAAENGELNEVIRVTGGAIRRHVRARVTGPGRVEVPLGGYEQ